MLIDVEQISQLFLFFLLLPQVNKCGGGCFKEISVRLVNIYLHVQKINRGFEYSNNDHKMCRQLFPYPKHRGENKVLPPSVSGKNFLISM